MAAAFGGSLALINGHVGGFVGKTALILFASAIPMLASGLYVLLFLGYVPPPGTETDIFLLLMLGGGFLSLLGLVFLFATLSIIAAIAFAVACLVCVATVDRHRYRAKAEHAPDIGPADSAS